MHLDEPLPAVAGPPGSGSSTSSATRGHTLSRRRRRPRQNPQSRDVGVAAPAPGESRRACVTVVSWVTDSRRRSPPRPLEGTHVVHGRQVTRADRRVSQRNGLSLVHLEEPPPGPALRLSSTSLVNKLRQPIKRTHLGDRRHRRRERLPHGTTTRGDRRGRLGQGAAPVAGRIAAAGDGCAPRSPPGAATSPPGAHPARVHPAVLRRARPHRRQHPAAPRRATRGRLRAARTCARCPRSRKRTLLREHRDHLRVTPSRPPATLAVGRAGRLPPQPGPHRDARAQPAPTPKRLGEGRSPEAHPGLAARGRPLIGDLLGAATPATSSRAPRW